MLLKSDDRIDGCKVIRRIYIKSKLRMRSETSITSQGVLTVLLLDSFEVLDLIEHLSQKVTHRCNQLCTFCTVCVITQRGEAFSTSAV